ncbi:MAG: bifunctional UDP-N-acetylglucosamine diphosphorylase/glucosamine-1-phosphate N-acetyltransferase GlmU [Actinomycetota bacterium]|nr:bifunctional UDP-N-acetylglucosamine diphosphorylase/glucosamine-1-phosphate N-acetyltransferase GlmU [Actinomycetota bacterium]
MTTDVAALVMAAGLGTRMHSELPKHLHPLLGRRMIDWVVASARAVEADPIVVVVAPDRADAFAGLTLAVQQEARGTGDAVAAARETLAGFSGDVLVLSGDTPLLTEEVLRGLIDAHRREGAQVTVLSFEPEDEFPYGRLIRGPDGSLERVVEERDATPGQLAITELNSSIYVFESSALWAAIDKLDTSNAQGELQLTDTIAHIVAAGGRAHAHRSPDPIAPTGVNTRADLAAAGAVLRDRINRAHMLAGTTIVDPATTWIEPDVELEPDSTIHPFTHLRGTTRVGTGAEVGPHAVAVDAEIGPRVVIGPFAYLRPGSVVGEGAKVGTFVELKNTRIGARTKVPHLSYLGDAEVGEDTNVAASNVTVNFPHRTGKEKGRTKIGSNVRTGVDNSFVAPVEIGDDAWIAAGTVITEDVPPGALAGFPPRQVTKEGYVYDERDDD